jgi:hypothetical protein
VVAHPRAALHYPRSVGEFQAWFRTDADCLDYLEWLRWPDGFVCPVCGHAPGWRLDDGRFECAGCHARTSTTAGTIFDRTRTPLTVWFAACWLFASGKDGISAQSLQRTLEIGSYQTAWALLHRLRSVLVRPGRDRLSGRVEVDETYIGGEEPGLRGGRAKGKKVLTGIAVEVREPKGIGRARMAPLADGSAASLHAFVSDHVEPGATVITDAWGGYRGLERLGYGHERRSQRAARARGQDPGELLPAVHRVAALAKRWLLGTHQGSVDPAHLPSYLDEFDVPLQPPPLAQPRAGVLPRPRTRRRPRARALPRPGRQPPGTRDAAYAAPDTRAPAQPRPAPGEPTLENALTSVAPVKWRPPNSVDFASSAIGAGWRLALYEAAGEEGGSFRHSWQPGRGTGGAGSDPERSRAEAARRARGQVRRYCATNRLNRLGTLTYAGRGCHDPRALRADLAGLFRALRRALGGEAFAYVWVPEWHKSGHGLHAHRGGRC